jgi:molybdopterin converting factor small subunit
VTVRYWAGARDLAGCVEESVDAAPLNILLERLGARHGHRLARVIAVSVVLIDGAKVDPSTAEVVTHGALVEVLPPFAGG